MGITTIEWARYTFNPWEGCSKISAGCKHCYAAVRDVRWHKGLHWGKDASRKKTSVNNWKNPLKWQRKAAAAGIRERVFCASLGDVFELHADSAMNAKLNEWRMELWNLIRITPNLDWLLLTKRPENVADMVPSQWLNTHCTHCDGCGWCEGSPPWICHECKGTGGGFPPNVWIGTSVENQEHANARIPHLLRIPARVRFLSMEPLLGPVNLSCIGSDESSATYNCLTGVYSANDGAAGPIIHCVIVGGESGRDARPMHPDWARSLRDQCAAAQVPYFFKQWGQWIEVEKPGRNNFTVLIDGDFCNTEWEEKLRWRGGKQMTDNEWNNMNPIRVYSVSKKKSGRLLDGVEHNAMPA